MLEEVASKADSWARIDGWSFVGWKNPDGIFVASKVNGTWRYSSVIVHTDLEYHAVWATISTYGMTQTWLDGHNSISTASGGDIATAAAMTAANGCRTVGECYALGINPEDPNDDLKITAFKMKDGKPEIRLNHTKDGSGNSFEDRVKILGKKELTDAEWQEVPPKGNPAHRFFKVGVEMP